MDLEASNTAGLRAAHRTAQIVWLHDSTYWSALWWADARSTPGKQILLDDLCDEALLWFFDRRAKVYCEQYLAPPDDGDKRCKRSLWVDSQLLQRATNFALRDGVPHNHLLHTAFTLYTKEFAQIPSDKQNE